MSDEREHALPDRVEDRAEGRVEGDADAGAEDGLRDGRFDAFVLTAERRDDAIALSCVVTAGPNRGDVVDIVSANFATRDPFDLVGLPCTLVVQGDTICLEP